MNTRINTAVKLDGPRDLALRYPRATVTLVRRPAGNTAVVVQPRGYKTRDAKPRWRQPICRPARHVVGTATG